MKKYYLPKEDAKLVEWLQNLSAKISIYAAKYGISAAEIAFIQNAAAYFIFWFNALSQLNGAVQKVTAFKNQIRDGVKAGGSQGVTPVDILFGTPPTAVPPGILPTIRTIVARIKKNQAYSKSDGEDLKIEGDEQTEDINTLKPAFKIELKAGHPNLIWKKGISQGVKIKQATLQIGQTPTPEAMAENKDFFTFLATDTQPDYLDNTPLPPFGQTVVWAYTMVYLLNDEEVGEWSDIVFVTVTGTP